LHASLFHTKGANKVVQYIKKYSAVCGGQLQTITYCQKLLPNAALPVNTLRNTHNRVYIKLKISICVLIKLALAPTGSKKTFSHVFAEYSTKRITEEMQQQRTAISFY